MPKEPSSSQNRRDKGKAPAAGPSGASAQQQQADKPIWQSDIPDTLIIWKTLAKQKYRLDNGDLAGHTHDRDCSNDDGRIIVKYKELEVQHIAWKRYGGPAGFWKILKAELIAYEKEHGTTSGFRYPHDYRRGGLYDLDKLPPPDEPEPHPEPTPTPDRSPSPSPPPEVPGQDPYVGNSNTLAEVKEQLPAWLWAACNSALDGPGRGPPTLTGAKLGLREDAMRTFVQSFAASYPVRPESVVPRTPFTAKFHHILDGAPGAPERGSANWGSPILRLKFVRTVQDSFYEWDETYLEKLFAVLVDLVSSELDGASWQIIRWAVYDKYVQCLHRGLRYDPANQQWSDKAKCWLDEHQYEVGTEELRDSLRDRCAAGRRFNDHFPIVID